MAYIGLGSVPVVASLIDPTGRNTGKWTAVMDSGKMAIKHPYFQMYHLTLKDGPNGSTCQIWLNNNFYDITPNGYLNSWDPNQPLEMQPGDNLYFYWSKATGTAPTVTAYFRYDSAFARLA